MRNNHTPYFIQQILHKFQQFYISRFIKPQFDNIGEGLVISSPRHLKLFGKNICAGRNLHIICAAHNPVSITTWHSKQNSGRINIGDYCLISPGVNIAAADSITINNNCMIAANCYISDCDWHGVYNRIRPFRCSKPVVLGENVWLGYGTIINKGITIGENSITAAGSVVVNDIPKNVIVGGNPAKVIKEISPDKRMLKREFMFNHSYQQTNTELIRWSARHNSFLKWLRVQFNPGKSD